MLSWVYNINFDIIPKSSQLSLMCGLRVMEIFLERGHLGLMGWEIPGAPTLCEALVIYTILVI